MQITNRKICTKNISKKNYKKIKIIKIGAYNEKDPNNQIIIKCM